MTKLRSHSGLLRARDAGRPASPVALSLVLVVPAVLAGLYACSSDDGASASFAEADGAAAGGGDPSAVEGGADGGVGGLPTEKSGTRLRRRMIGPLGGSARMFVGWFDRERANDCAFERAAVLGAACLPALGGGASAAVFLDNGCTAKPVASILEGECASGHVVAQEEPSGDAGPPFAVSLYPIGAPVDAGTTYALGAIGSSRTCRPSSAPATRTLHALGDAIPASAYLQATESISSLRDVVVRSLRAGDGSERVITYALPGPSGATSLPCTPVPYADGSRRCVDTARARPIFADGTCSGVPIAYVDDPSRKWLVVASPTSCLPDAVSAFESVASTVSAGTGFTLVGQSCVPAPSAGRGPRALGTPVSAGAYPPVTVSVGADGAVRALVRNVDGYVSVVGFRDSTRGVPCAFAPTADGKIRCVPDARARGDAYLDASCTESAAGLYDFEPTTCGEPAPTEALVPRWSVEPCRGATLTNVYRTARETRSVFDKLSDGRCVPAETPRYRATDEEVPLGALPEGDIVVE